MKYFHKLRGYVDDRGYFYKDDRDPYPKRKLTKEELADIQLEPKLTATGDRTWYGYSLEYNAHDLGLTQLFILRDDCTQRSYEGAIAVSLAFRLLSCETLDRTQELLHEIFTHQP